MRTVAVGPEAPEVPASSGVVGGAGFSAICRFAGVAVGGDERTKRGGAETRTKQAGRGRWGVAGGEGVW